MITLIQPLGEINKHLQYLMSHQASSVWSPDTFKVSFAKSKRLCQAHGLIMDPSIPVEERFAHNTQLRSALDKGALIISFTNENL